MKFLGYKYLLFFVFIFLNFLVKTQTITTYSVLNTAYNRVASSYYPLGSTDNYWFLTKIEDLVVPNNPASVINYPNASTYVVPNVGNNFYAGIVADRSINTNATTTSLGLKLITFRTYFNLPNLSTTNNRYSLSFKMSADDAVNDVKLNGTMKGQFLSSTYNHIPGISAPYLLNIPICDTDFVSGQNYIDVTIADAGGSVGFYGEVTLFEVTNPFNMQLISSALCNGLTATASASLSTTLSNSQISYTWLNSSGVVSQTNSSASYSNSVSNLSNGIYTVIAQASSSCGTISSSNTLTINCINQPTIPSCVGIMTGTGMSSCNQYSFSITPSQTIIPFNYGSQGYACTGATMPDVSFNIIGPAWRVMKNNWFFRSSVAGEINGYTNSGALQTLTFSPTNTITPFSYSGSFVQFAINGVPAGLQVNQTTFSISLNSSLHSSNNYTYCPTSNSLSISPNIPSQGGPWTYSWQPGGLIGNPLT
jgi:hypothetical protein